MAKARTGTSGYDPKEAPLEKAYVWGKRGVEVTTALLQNWLDGHTRQNIVHRQQVLQRHLSVRGAGGQHLIAVILGLGVFLTALFVDYNIIHEFWTRALSNEFGEVPPSMANTVAAKSLQVLFATLAVHYLITHIGHGGRIAYSLLIFAITAVMVVGIGLLWANDSLPAGSKVFDSEVSSSAAQVDSFMKGLGIKPPARKAAALPKGWGEVKKYETVIWLFSLGVIFLVVASIGAMALHTAIRGFTAMTGGAVYDHHKEVQHVRGLRAELQRTHVDLKHLDDSDFGESKLAEFITHYTDGVVAGRFSSSRQRILLQKANAAASEVDTGVVSEESGGNVNNIDDYRARRAAHA
jgi:hypothetical protein